MKSRSNVLVPGRTNSEARKREMPKKPRKAYGRGTGIPHPVDIHVGGRVRLRRTLLGLSQTALGEAIGITFQQLQKYENGSNRISASRLFDLSRVLDVPVGFFFDGVLDPAVPATGESPRFETDPMAKRETIELVRAYYKISDPYVRQCLRGMAVTLAGMGAASEDDARP